MEAHHGCTQREKKASKVKSSACMKVRLTMSVMRIAMPVPSPGVRRIDTGKNMRPKKHSARVVPDTLL